MAAGGEEKHPPVGGHDDDHFVPLPVWKGLRTPGVSRNAVRNGDVCNKIQLPHQSGPWAPYCITVKTNF